VFLVLSIVFYTSNAQITKRYWMVGGSAAATRQQQNRNDIFIKTTQIRILPNISYFFADKFAAGVKPALDILTSSINNSGSSSTSFSIEPFIRYYFLPPVRVVNLFAEANYEYSWYSNAGKTNGYKF